jgi:hypothetical protein
VFTLIVINKNREIMENRIGLDESFLCDREIYNKIVKMSDRELAEFEAITKYKTGKSIMKIEKNIQFFLYFTLACVLASLYLIFK